MYKTSLSWKLWDVMCGMYTNAKMYWELSKKVLHLSREWIFSELWLSSWKRFGCYDLCVCVWIVSPCFLHSVGLIRLELILFSLSLPPCPSPALPVQLVLHCSQFNVHISNPGIIGISWISSLSLTAPFTNTAPLPCIFLGVGGELPLPFHGVLLEPSTVVCPQGVSTWHKLDQSNFSRNWLQSRVTNQT